MSDDLAPLHALAATFLKAAADAQIASDATTSLTTAAVHGSAAATLRVAAKQLRDRLAMVEASRVRPSHPAVVA